MIATPQTPLCIDDETCLGVSQSATPNRTPGGANKGVALDVFILGLVLGVDFRVIYAPWRYKYIKNIGREEGCFLCKAAAESDRDDENLVPVRGRHVFAILNKYPYTWGHVMVAPYRHISQFEELNEEEWVEMVKMAGRLMKAVAKVTGARDFIVGINIGRVAGAGLEDHIHLHIIPKDTEVNADNLEEALLQLTRDLRRAYD